MEYFFYFFLKLTQNLLIQLFSFFRAVFSHFITIHKTPVLFIQFCKHGYSHTKMWIMWITRCITPFYHVFLCTFVWKVCEQNVESKVVYVCSFDFLCRFTLLFFVKRRNSVFFCVHPSDNLSNCIFNSRTNFPRFVLPPFSPSLPVLCNVKWAQANKSPFHTLKSYLLSLWNQIYFTCAHFY